jgi:hypothetical protein
MAARTGMTLGRKSQGDHPNRQLTGSAPAVQFPNRELGMAATIDQVIGIVTIEALVEKAQPGEQSVE